MRKNNKIVLFVWLMLISSIPAFGQSAQTSAQTVDQDARRSIAQKLSEFHPCPSKNKELGADVTYAITGTLPDSDSKLIEFTELRWSVQGGALTDKLSRANGKEWKGRIIFSVKYFRYWNDQRRKWNDYQEYYEMNPGLPSLEVTKSVDTPFEMGALSLHGLDCDTADSIQGGLTTLTSVAVKKREEMSEPARKRAAAIMDAIGTTFEKSKQNEKENSVVANEIAERISKTAFTDCNGKSYLTFEDPTGKATMIELKNLKYKISGGGRLMNPDVWFGTVYLDGDSSGKGDASRIFTMDRAKPGSWLFEPFSTTFIIRLKLDTGKWSLSLQSDYREQIFSPGDLSSINWNGLSPYQNNKIRPTTCDLIQPILRSSKPRYK